MKRKLDENKITKIIRRYNSSRAASGGIGDGEDTRKLMMLFVNKEHFFSLMEKRKNALLQHICSKTILQELSVSENFS